jgi:hypothetical protein
VCGWLSTCAAYFYIETEKRQRLLAILGALIAVAFIAMKLLWFVPGHFTRAEWMAFGLWIGAGIVVRYQARHSKSARDCGTDRQPLLLDGRRDLSDPGKSSVSMNKVS